MTEGAKVMEKLGAGGVAESICRIMKVRVVLGDPTRGEKTMFGGDVVAE